MTRAQRLRPLVWLTTGALMIIASGSGPRVHAFTPALAPESAAQIGGPPPTYELLARHSGKCLSVYPSLSDGAGAVQWECVGQTNQQWTLDPVGDGSYYLRLVYSGQCLSVYPSPLDGAAVVQWTCVGQTNQQWTLESAGGDYSILRLRYSSKVLTVAGASALDGGALIQATSTSAPEQQWLVRQVGGTPPPPPPPTTADIVRFLEQSTWGPTSDLVEHVRQVGFDAFLTEQFEAPMSSYPALPAVPTTRDNATCPSGSTCQRDNYTLYLLQNQFFRNGLYGQDQLRQRVAFALHQIIVVSGVDISLPFWYAPYLQILDRDAFGSYRDLLYDITLNPAMGNYLDVTGNTRTRPNENYAREVLQLFSIGTFKLNPDGTQQKDGAGQPVPTYGQTDVSNFARVFTGWVRAVAPGPGILNYVDPMVANEGQHDVAAKALLNGVVLPANQNTAKDTSDAIDNIANDPSIGPYISKSLIQHLVTSNPSPAYVARVTAVFNGDRGNLRSLVRAILLDPEARGDAKTDPSYGRLRHPAQLILNLGRAFNARSRDLTAESDGVLNAQAVSMGMDIFRPPSVFSYFSPFNGVPGGGGLRGPEFGLLSTATALTRANVINTLVFGGVNVGTNAPNGTALDFSALQVLAGNPTALVNALDVLLLHGTMSSAMRGSIVGAVNAVSATNTLKRARTAVYLVATSSQYQVER